MRYAPIALALALLAGFAALCTAATQPREDGWWMHGRHGGWMMGGWARHHYAMMDGVPSPYTATSNPLPRTQATLDRGKRVYRQNCASCHGDSGHGDGPAAATLTPPPADLAWLAAMPMSQWDAYMNWTVSEGGAPFGTAMPAFKDALSRDEIWSVIAYVQNELPGDDKPPPR